MKERDEGLEIEVQGEVLSTAASSYPNYLAHCIGCRGTDRLTLFAHRIEGQMVGWIFACLDCAPKVPRLQIEIEFNPGASPTVTSMTMSL